MNPETIKLVKDCWAQVKPVSESDRLLAALLSG